MEDYRDVDPDLHKLIKQLGEILKIPYDPYNMSKVIRVAISKLRTV